MATVNYFLRSSKRDETETSIYAWVFISKTEKQLDKKILFKINTRLKCPALQWSEKEGRCKIGADPRQQSRNDATNRKLDEIRKALLADIDQHISYSPGLASEVIASFHQDRSESVPTAPMEIVAFCRWLVKAMEDGAELNRGKRYGVLTIRQYKLTATVMERFCRHYADKHGARPTWSDFGRREVCNEFMTWLGNDAEFLPSTRNKFVSQFQTILKLAAREHLHSHEGWTMLYQITEDRDEARTKVYLTDTEIDALYDLPLEIGSWRCKVRDVFLCGCFTGQRISDYGRLTADCFRVTEKGTHIVEMKQKKTGKHVVIPVLDDRLLTIAGRYGGDLPHIWPQNLGRDIKLILKDLSETVPSLAVKFPTVLTLPERRAEEKARAEGNELYERDAQGRVIVPKWALVSTHTARRSCITNLYKRHLFTDRQLMSISGHSDVRTLFGYILEGDRETAEEIAAKMAEFKKKSANEDLF